MQKSGVRGLPNIGSTVRSTTARTASLVPFITVYLMPNSSPTPLQVQLQLEPRLRDVYIAPSTERPVDFCKVAFHDPKLWVG